jgi:hypothetical protein
MLSQVTKRCNTQRHEFGPQALQESQVSKKVFACGENRPALSNLYAPVGSKQEAETRGRVSVMRLLSNVKGGYLAPWIFSITAYVARCKSFSSFSAGAHSAVLSAIFS